MRSVIAIGEVLAFLGLAPGFVATAVVYPLRRPLDNLSRPVQRLPPDQFRTVIMLPMVSVFAGTIAGIGANQLVGNRTLVGYLLLMASLAAVAVGGQLAMTPVGRKTVAYRREVLARLAERNWTVASRAERARGARLAGRLATTGSRLIRFAEHRTFRQWLRQRNRLPLCWIVLATGYATAVLVFALVNRIRHNDWTVGWGSLLIVSLPALGPGQLWLWYLMSRATLRDFGTELHRDAAAVLAAITTAPPWDLRHRARQAIRLLLDLDADGTGSAGR